MAETKFSDDGGDPAGPASVYQLLGCVDEAMLLPDDNCTAADEHQYMFTVAGYDDDFGTANLDDEPSKLCQGKTDEEDHYFHITSDDEFWFDRYGNI